MRKILLNAALSLDGRIEGPAGECDWCYADQDYGMTAFLDRIDTIMMGRRSYLALQKQAEAAGTTPHAMWPDKKIVIVSRNLKDAPDGTKLINERGIEPLKMRRKKKDIWLFGGAQLFTALLGADLVDEMHLAMHPVLLGPGKPLLEGLHRRVDFELIEHIAYSTGLVQLIYRRNPVQNIGAGGQIPEGD